MIQATKNFILVEIEKKFQDKEGVLVVDTTWRPEEFATLEGVVVSAPVMFESDQRKVVTHVKRGDKLFFSYSVIFDYECQKEDENPVYKNLIRYDGREYWKVEAGEVFCKVGSDGSLCMVTDNILLEPIHGEKVSIPGLVIIQDKEPNSGVVKAMPVGGRLSCSISDTVFFESRFAQKYNIFGKEHYIIPMRRVLAKT